MVRRQQPPSRGLAVNSRWALLALGLGALAVTLPPLAAAAEAAASDGGATPNGPDSGGAERIEITGTADRSRLKSSSTATKMDVATRDVPASLQVISPQMIEDQSKGQSINDVLRNVSGVAQSYGTATGNLPAVNMRGFDTGGYVMRDGYGQASGSTYDWSSIERLEVLKGPSSVLYGTQYNIGGQINIISKRPVDRRVAEVEMSVGRWNYGRVALDVGNALDEDHRLLYRFNAAWDDADSFRDAVYERNLYLAPSLKWAVGDADQLLLQAEYKDRHYNWDTGLPSYFWGDFDGHEVDYPGLSRVRRGRDLPIHQYIGLPGWDGQRETKHTLTLEWEHDFNDDWHLKVGTAPVLTDYQGRFSYFYWGWDDPDEDGVLLPEDHHAYLLAGSYGYHSREWPVTADLTGHFDTWGLKHTILMGASYTKGRWHDSGPGGNDVMKALEPIGLEDWRHPPAYTLVNDPDYDVSNSWQYEQEEFGAYVQDLVELSDQWKALVGYRIGRARGSYEYIWGSDVYTGDSHYRGHTPRLGLVHQPSKTLSLYAGWSQSFTPNWGRLKNGGTPPPETGSQWELGLKQDFADGKANLNVALYRINKSNVARCAPESSDCKIIVVAGSQRSQGLEIDLNGQISPNLRLTNAITFQRAKVTKDVSTDAGGLPVGDKLTGVPQWIFDVFAVYEFKTGPWSGLDIGGGYNAAGETEANLPNDGYRLPGLRRVDLMAGYRLTPTWRLQANLNNLTNHVNYSSPGWGYMAFANKPRELVLTASARF